MRITESSINMASARQYSQSGTRSKRAANISSVEDMRGTVESRTKDALNGGYAGGDSYNGSNNVGMKGTGFTESTYSYPKSLESLNGSSTVSIGDGLTAASQFQNLLLSMIMTRFGGFGTPGGNTRQLVTYQEYENTRFHANGTAKTDDGRVIDFNVEIMMSRSYMEYMNIQIPSVQNALCDPLVINIGTDTADVRDQKFMFDIDADGSEDEISMLGRGSGFLALDKNGDGEINDGSELFGTRSGDGFRDLREYDSDGNGWIDENDAVFEKLRVWCKGSNGEDILMNLKEADIGAIFLGSQETEFTTAGEDGIRDGVIRSTGVFLRESGARAGRSAAGTIQHVDMALGSADDTAQAAGGNVVTQTVVYTNISSGESRQSASSGSRAKRREILAKKAAEAKARKELEQRRIDRHYEQKQTEKRLENRRLMRERIYKMKQSGRLVEDEIMDMLFMDTGLYSVI